MKPFTRISILIFFICLILFLPWLSEYIIHKGDIPDGFFSYPALKAGPKPGFNIYIFSAIALFVLFIASIYLFPSAYGFKQIKQKKLQSQKHLPVWFYIGIAITVTFGILIFGNFTEPKFLVYYGFIPTFWGYSMILDGIVYKRTNGNSFFSNSIRLLIPMATSSTLCWAIFAYMNFFVDANWYYPIGNYISQPAFYLYAFAGGMTLTPLVIINYQLLKTFPKLTQRFSYGPKIILPKNIRIAVLIGTLALMYAVTHFPFLLFPMLWLGPAIILGLVLDFIGLWTPFKPIAEKGNWSPLALVALAGLFQGFLWEGTNYFSASHHPFAADVPGYWIYSLPYVNVLHIFEMPLLGFFGYMPYAVFCWIFWLVIAYLFNTPEKFEE